MTARVPCLPFVALCSALLLATAGPSLAQKTPFAYARDSVKLLVLRGLDGEPIIQNGFVGAAVLANGSVAFADRYEPRIVLFDSLGRFVAAAGRKGAGPGEFQEISRIMRFRGDSIAVFDGSLRRISVFDRALRFARTEPVV